MTSAFYCAIIVEHHKIRACSSVDRVPGYEPVGRRFESCQARQKAEVSFDTSAFCFPRQVRTCVQTTALPIKFESTSPWFAGSPIDKRKCGYGELGGSESCQARKVKTPFGAFTYKNRSALRVLRFFARLVGENLRANHRFTCQV